MTLDQKKRHFVFQPNKICSSAHLQYLCISLNISFLHMRRFTNSLASVLSKQSSDRLVSILCIIHYCPWITHVLESLFNFYFSQKKRENFLLGEKKKKKPCHANRIIKWIMTNNSRINWLNWQLMVHINQCQVKQRAPSKGQFSGYSI